MFAIIGMNDNLLELNTTLNMSDPALAAATAAPDWSSAGMVAGGEGYALGNQTDLIDPSLCGNITPRYAEVIIGITH